MLHPRPRHERPAAQHARLAEDAVGLHLRLRRPGVRPGSRRTGAACPRSIRARRPSGSRGARPGWRRSPIRPRSAGGARTQRAKASASHQFACITTCVAPMRVGLPNMVCSTAPLATPICSTWRGPRRPSRPASRSSQSQPCGLPQLLPVVAAVVDELHVLRPGDRLRVDLEGGHLHRLVAALDVQGEAGVVGPAQGPARRRQQQRRPDRDPVRQLQAQRDARWSGRWSPVPRRAGPRGTGPCGRSRARRPPPGCAPAVPAWSPGCPAGRRARLPHPAAAAASAARAAPGEGRTTGPPAGPPRPGARHRADSAAPGALRIARDPVFRQPGHVAGQPQRGHRVGGRRHPQVLAQALLQAGQQLQRVVARVHERQRQVLAAGAAHGGRVDGGGDGHEEEKRASTRYKHRCHGQPSVTMLSGWPGAHF